MHGNSIVIKNPGRGANLIETYLAHLGGTDIDEVFEDIQELLAEVRFESDYDERKGPKWGHVLMAYACRGSRQVPYCDDFGMPHNLDSVPMFDARGVEMDTVEVFCMHCAHVELKDNPNTTHQGD